LGNISAAAIAALTFPMFLVVFLLLLRIVVRNQKAAVGILVAVTAVTGGPAGTDPRLAFAFNLIGILMILYLLFPCGLLSIVVAAYIQNLFNNLPLSLDLSVWYAAPTLLAALMIAGLAAYSLRIALAGRSLYRDPIFSQ